MAGIDEIKRLKRLCEEYGLEGREILSRHTDEELAGIFNGIGPDAFPQRKRILQKRRKKVKKKKRETLMNL